MRSAVYCRVSTIGQDREGTSLESQKEACLKKAQELGFETPPDNIILEDSSGLLLDRPKLSQVRNWIRSKDIDSLIIYCLDRLTRDPAHLAILQEELERSGIQLVCVTEDVDNSDLGKLVTYIRGYAAKLEALKIRERVTRGKKWRIEKEGKLPTGRALLFGYSYDSITGTNHATEQFEVVRMIGKWLISEGIPLNEVARRLMKQGIPAPMGGQKWSRGTLGRILKNPVYAGKEYANKTMTVETPDGRKKRKVSLREDWAEIPLAVDKVAFTEKEWELIQKRLSRNKELAARNQKLNYLLRGFVYCRRCGRKFYGASQHGKPYYRCAGRNSLLMEHRCDNTQVNAKWLENEVWSQISRIITSPEFLLQERPRPQPSPKLSWEADLKRITNQLANLDQQRDRLWYALRITNDRAKFEKQVKQLETESKSLIAQRDSLKKRIEDWQNTKNLEKLGGCPWTFEFVRDNLTSEGKRMTLENLDIKVYVDGHSITLDGSLPVVKEALQDGNIVSLPLQWV
jgi:site-specific DNA recombinase